MKSIIFFIIFFIFSLSAYNQTEITTRLNHYLNKLAPNLEVKWLENKGLVLVTKGYLKKGDKIISIPKDYVLSNYDNYPRSYFFYEMYKQSGNDMLMGRLLYEKFIQNFGFLKEYFVSLIPEEMMKDNGFYWNEEDSNEFKKRLAYVEEPSFDYDGALDPIKKLIEINKPFLDKYQPKFTEEMFQEKELRWAYGLIARFGLRWSKTDHCILNNFDPKDFKRIVENVEGDFKYEEDGLVLVPFVNLISHEGTRNYIGEYDLFQFKDHHDLFKILGHDVKSKINLTLSFTDNSLFDYLYLEPHKRNVLANYITPEKDNLILYSNKKYKPGEELSYSHGPFSNSILFSQLGFIDENNSLESFLFRGSWEKFNDQERNISVKLGLTNPIDIEKGYTTFFFTPYQVNHKFIGYLRMFLINTQKLTPEFNETKTLEIFRRGHFKNQYLESMLWHNYFLSLDYRNGFRTHLAEDRNDLAKEMGKNSTERNNKKIISINIGIKQKENIYKHLKAGWGKFMKSVHYGLNLGFVKECIMKIVAEPETYREAMFYYTDQD